METIVRAPKIWLCEVSESIAAEKEYRLLGLLVQHRLSYIYVDISFQLQYTYLNLFCVKIPNINELIHLVT